MRRWHYFTLGIVVGIGLAAGIGSIHSTAELTGRQATSVAPANPPAGTAPASTTSTAATSRTSTTAATASITATATGVDNSAGEPADDGKLRVLVFGAHPDDCEIRAGGAAMLWNGQGHHVKFVSTTNGDIGHWRMAGGPLAKRRFDEVQQVAKILGVTTTVLDIHDGEIMPTLENRRIFTRLIRRWNADIVIGHRPNDYHPDHRYTGILMQDSAFIVGVPFFCPDTAPLKKNPVFLYSYDRFERPNPFRPDVVVSIDEVIEEKAGALVLMESQFVEGGALGSADRAPKNEAEREARRKAVHESFKRRFARTADACREKLVDLYGEEAGRKVQYAEAFEICEYGRQPSKKELLELFPFLPER